MFRIRPTAALLAFAASLAAARPSEAPPPVMVAGGAFMAGDAPLALSCADGVPLPEPAEADALAERLAACGFDMVRLPDVAAPEDAERLDAFAAALAHRGLRLWADALVPALAVPPAPADVSLIDDPATAAAWTNALAEAAATGFDPFLAAPWDPRLESLLQHRLRDWARAFNPATGLRRNEDPAWALVGFSSGWRNAFLFSAAATNAPAPPAFFREGFLAEWNAWLYERYKTDTAARHAGATKPRESVEKGTVAWFGTPFGSVPAAGIPDVRLRDQKIFLQTLYLAHVRRLILYFQETGGLAASVPVFARWGEGANLLAPLSDVRFAGTPEEGFPTVAFFPAEESDAAAADIFGGAAMLVFPACGIGPERFAPYARLFRAAAAARRGPDATVADTPGSAVLVAPFRSRGEPPATRRFDATGAVLRIHPFDPDDDPDDLDPEPPKGRGLSVVVWFPEPEDGDDAPASPDADRVLEFVFAPDTPGAPMGVFVRVRDKATGTDVPFGLSVAGSSLRKREWRDLSTGAEPGPQSIPEDRVVRLPAAAGPRLLLFPPETVESDILKRLGAEAAGL